MGINKSTFKHTAIYSLAAVLGKAIGFLMLPLYAHILGDAGYGVIGMIDVGLSFLLSLLGRSVAGALARFYHEEAGEDKNAVISTGIWLTFGTSIVLVVIAAIFSKPICNLLLGDSSYFVLLLLALGSFTLDLVGQAAGAVLIIQRRSLPFSAVGLLRLVIGLSLNIYLILILKLELLGYFLSGLLTTVVPAVIFLTIAYRQCGTRFDRRIARKIIAYQLPLVPGALASFGSNQIERILIRFLINIQSVGVLEMGYKFPVLLNMLITYPLFRSWDTKRIEIAQSGDPQAPHQIGKMFTYHLFLLIFAGLAMAVGIKDILKILTPPEFWPAYKIARIQILAMIFFGATFHVNFGLFFQKVTKTWAYILSVTSIGKVALSFIFISTWGFQGAVYASCLVELSRLIWGGWRGQKLYRIEIEYRKIFTMSALAIVLFVVLNDVELLETRAVQSVATNQVPQLLEKLEGTFLKTWKEGKVIHLLDERSDLILSLLIKTLLCLSFGLLFPFIHGPSGRNFMRRLGLARPKAGP